MRVIYKISSDLYPERVYIGSARSFSNRIRLHVRHLEEGVHHNPKLQNHYNKYGSKDLSFSIIERVKDNDKLIEREQYYLDTLKPYFNICLTAGSREGLKNSPSHCEKISKAQKVSMLGNKNGIGNKGWKGKKLSEEHKRRIKENHWRKKVRNEDKVLLQPDTREDGCYKSE